MCNKYFQLNAKTKKQNIPKCIPNVFSHFCFFLFPFYESIKQNDIDGISI